MGLLRTTPFFRSSFAIKAWALGPGTTGAHAPPGEEGGPAGGFEQVVHRKENPSMTIEVLVPVSTVGRLSVCKAAWRQILTWRPSLSEKKSVPLSEGFFDTSDNTESKPID
mmetsp:Transcript_94445/g.272989  ORF Transcript_94445/g.272989 Transcript_94445/m.272989 type:complete len:111 (-) Transcript_94445:1267-1599(-)